MSRRDPLAASPPKPFREYPGVRYYEFELPPDFRVPAEWTFARLMYPPLGWRSDWENGSTSWTIDYPRADRHIVEMVRRLTSVDARSVEQPVNLDDDDDVFNWPWLYAVEVGHVGADRRASREAARVPCYAAVS